MGALKVRNYIRINGALPVLFDTLTESEKKKIGFLLNATALMAIGYEPDKEEFYRAWKRYEEMMENEQ